MGNKTWTTDRQRDFLKDNIPQFELAQKSKSTGPWLSKFVDQYFTQFPVEAPAGQEEVVMQLSKKRIRAWFNNHSGARNLFNQPRVRFSLRNNPVEQMLAGSGALKGRQTLQPKQAFSVMYWDSKLKPVIEKEWAEKIKAEPELAGNRGAALAFRNSRVGQIYDTAPDEVKALVEDFRTKKKTDSQAATTLLSEHEENLPDEQKAEIISSRSTQRAIQNMSATANYFVRTVNEVTKGPVLVLSGAEDPEKAGEFHWTQVTCGERLLDGKDFFSFSTKFNDFFAEFKQFGISCFPSGRNAGQALAPPTPTPVNHHNPLSSPDRPSLSVTFDANTLIKLDDPVGTDFDSEDGMPGFDYNPPDPPAHTSASIPVSTNKSIFRKRKGTPGLRGIHDDDDDSDEDSANAEEEYALLSDLGDTTDEDTDETREADNQSGSSRFPDPKSPTDPSLNIDRRVGDSDDDTGRVRLVGGAWVSNLEYRRLKNIGRNRKLWREMGLVSVEDAKKEAQTQKNVRTTAHNARSRVPLQVPTHLGPRRVPPPRISKSTPKSYVAPDPNGKDLDVHSMSPALPSNLIPAAHDDDDLEIIGAPEGSGQSLATSESSILQSSPALNPSAAIIDNDPEQPSNDTEYTSTTNLSPVEHNILSHPPVVLVKPVPKTLPGGHSTSTSTLISFPPSNNASSPISSLLEYWQAHAEATYGT